MDQVEEIDPVEEICGALREMTRRTEKAVARMRARHIRFRDHMETGRQMDMEEDRAKKGELALAEETIKNGLKRERLLGEALQFVADQQCQTPIEYEGGGGYTECSETDKCVTEYCLPCYAKAHLKQHAFEVEVGSPTCHHSRSVHCEHCNREICPDCGKGYCIGGC